MNIRYLITTCVLSFLCVGSIYSENDQTAASLSSQPLAELEGYEVRMATDAAATLQTGQWYAMYNRGTNHGYLFERVASHSLYNTSAAPSGLAKSACRFLVKLEDAGDGKYYVQTGYGNYFGAIAHKTNVPVTASATEAITIAKIGGNDGHFYLQSADGTLLDANSLEAGDATVVGWGTTVPTSLNGNNDWAFFPITLVEAAETAATDIFTISHASRGTLRYDPSRPYWVWTQSSVNASDVNQQWILCPTGTDAEYYLYNVGARKFAVPVNGGSFKGYTWAFSTDAVPVTLQTQSDGTHKIFTVAGNTVMAISSGYTGPVINYNDDGAKFTITRQASASADVAAQVQTAVSRLFINHTPLTALPSDGWYAIRVRTHNTYKDCYLFPTDAETDYNGVLYPLGFYNAHKLTPSSANPTYFFRLTPGNGSYTWQMANGRYLHGANNKFPVSSATKDAVTVSYDTNGFRFSSGRYYAVPYLLSSKYFVGETSNATTTYYDLYKVDLEAEGLVAWQAFVDGGAETTKLTCTHADAVGATSVYSGGYFFLPVGVTPVSDDFTMEGFKSCVIDAEAKTITASFDPTMAITVGNISVSQGFQTTGRGNAKALLLRITLSPFRDMTDVTLSVALKGNTADNIEELTLFRAADDSPEFLAMFNLTTVATTTDVAGSVDFHLDNLSAGAAYFWLTAKVKDDAALGEILDAALSSITYTCGGAQTALVLASVGDPEARGAMVFDTQQHVFIPTTFGSNVYRIPALNVAPDGSILVAYDKRYSRSDDIGNGHVIDIVLRRSTDGGRTWSKPTTIAKGDNSNPATCGYGDPSLTVGTDGRIYCLFAAGNTGYFYGLNRIAMSISSDNGRTWSSPVDLYETGRITDHTQYGLYDYFVTSGRGLCTDDGILMYLLPAQCYTDAAKTSHISNSNDYVFYSTDNGATWHFSKEIVYTGGDEAKLAQLNDGSLIASVRQAGNRGFNRGTYTRNADGTVTFKWGTQSRTNQLYQPSANNQDILYYSRKTDGEPDIMLHTMTTGSHADLRLYMSLDQGSNWKQVLNIQPAGSRYVTMVKTQNGDLAFAFEDYSLGAGNIYHINYLTITREQILKMYTDAGGVLPDNITVPQAATDAASTNPAYYNLSGQRVANPQRGIYILNGRKVVLGQ